MVTNSPTTVTAALGRIVDYALREQRISRSQAAAKLGMGRETLRRRIEGSQGFQMDELAAVAHILGIDASALVAQAESLAASSSGMKASA